MQSILTVSTVPFGQRFQYCKNAINDFNKVTAFFQCVVLLIVLITLVVYQPKLKVADTTL